MNLSGTCITLLIMSNAIVEFGLIPKEMMDSRDDTTATFSTCCNIAIARRTSFQFHHKPINIIAMLMMMIAHKASDEMVHFSLVILRPDLEIG